MPTYEYECDACGHTFEKFQSMTARPVKKCPACGARRARRRLGTGAGIIFKGSGFYATDYRSSSYKESARKDKAEASGSSSSGKDAKPAAGKDSGKKTASGSGADSKSP